MAFLPIDTLIDKQDGFEIARDQIASILAIETLNQQGLAILAGKDSELWKLNIFSEAANPFEKWLNIDDNTDFSPIINISFDNGTFPGDKGDPVKQQAHEVVYNIDCYGVAVSVDEPGGGHKPGDREAAFEVQRAIRLVRNILMAAPNVNLQLRNIVWRRWPQSIVLFRPGIEDSAMQHVHGARIAFRVGVTEESPQITPVELELLSVDVKRQEDGQIIVEADYPFTP